MLILGIDPGVARVGWAVLDAPRELLLGCGCLETSPRVSTGERLKHIYEFLGRVFTDYKPDCMVVEELFFANNAKTAMLVSEGRGVILLAGVTAGVEVFTYTPLEVKQAITGYGQASKSQIGLMVKSILKLSAIPSPDDAADAVALALTHAFTYKAQNAYTA